jgi:two-component system response regulator (stage 0 sporulation protein F)
MMKVLVVDDETRIRKLIVDMLGLDGYEVDNVDNASEAFRMVTVGAYEVIIMDLNMPGMNGLEGIRNIKMVKPDQKIIVLTGYSTDRTKEQAIEAGANECLFKPLGIQEIPSVIADITS